MPEVITNNLDLWSSALLTKSTAGRGNNGKLEAYGIKKLRELILGAALRGLFDEKNESLPGTIEQDICNAKNAYYKSIGKKLKEYAFGSALLNEFDLPSGWAWKRVGDLCDLQTGATPSTQNPKNFGGDIRWLVSGDINQGIIEDCEGRITEAGLTNSNCKILPSSTVLIALNGQGKTRASVALLNVPAACNQSLVGIIPFDASILDATFLLLSLRYRYYEIRDITGQNQRRGLNMGLVAELSIPLPPLAEQHRIVAKVDELMALCDQLEQQQTHSIAAHQTLVASLLGTLTRVESQQEFSAAWARIESHFDTLFTTEASIDQLKQTILQLAVMGKLAPQSPNDEPASALLQRIQAEKANRISEGRVKQDKPLPEIAEDDIPYALPQGWVWVRLGVVGETNIGLTYSPSDISSTGTPVLRSGNIQHGKIVLSDLVRVQMEVKSSVLVQEGDLLICARNGSKALVGKTALINNLQEEMAFGAFMAIFRSPVNQYLLLFIHSPLFRKMIDEVNTVTINQITQSNLRSTIFPLPPFVEQQRIVAKVEELMALCDTLKANLSDAQAIQHHLADAIVEQAVC